MEPSLAQLTRFVDVALDNVGTEYPYHLVHLARGDADVRPPRALYPAFHGSYDWHSCVHMHWSLARAVALAPASDAAARATAHLDARLGAANLAGEVAYFEGLGSAAFERPYGWAWLLLLAAEVGALPGEAARRWAAALEPLAALLRGRFLAWLPRADFPTRAGTHGNGAFALVLAETAARAAGDRALHGALRGAARRWYGADRTYPARYEPGGDDFLSGGLCEALAMARLCEPGEYAAWWRGFAPAAEELAVWERPVAVSDPEDPKIVHLAGLNLSRAWCWRELAPHLAAGAAPELAPRAAAAARAHLAASLPAATSGDYVGTHWLVSFALLALTGDRPTPVTEGGAATRRG